MVEIHPSFSTKMAPRVPLLLNLSETEKGTNDQIQELIDVFVKNGGTQLDITSVLKEDRNEKINIHNCVLNGTISLSSTSGESSRADYSLSTRIREQVEKYIDRIEKRTNSKTNKIQTLFLDLPPDSRSTIEVEEIVKTINELTKEGKFQQLGLCNFAAWEIGEFCSLAKQNNYIQPKFYQGSYNFLQREIESNLLLSLRYWKIDLNVLNPLVIENSIGNNGIPPPSSRTVRRFYQAIDCHKHHHTDVIQLLREIVEKNGIGLEEASLRWLQYHSILTEIDGITISSSSTQQLENKILHCTKGPLPNEIVEAMEKAWLSVKQNGPLYRR